MDEANRQVHNPMSDCVFVQIIRTSRWNFETIFLMHFNELFSALIIGSYITRGTACTGRKNERGFRGITVRPRHDAVFYSFDIYGGSVGRDGGKRIQATIRTHW